MITPNQLLYQQKRFRGKINIQKPRKPFYIRAVVEKFLTPVYPKDENLPRTLQEACTNINKKAMVEANTYQKFIAREVQNWFTNSKMVAILHGNYITLPDKFDFEVMIRKNNMYLKRYTSVIIREALENSPYAAVMPLTTSSFYFVFSPNTPVVELKKALRKYPQLTLLGGILYDKLLHLEDFLKYGELDIKDVQVQLVATLQNAGGVGLSRHLTHHQSTLVSRLNQIGTKESAPAKNEQSVPV